MKTFKKPCKKCEKIFQPNGKFQKICENCKKLTPKSTEEDLNYEMYKNYYKNNQQSIRLLIKVFIKKCPKDILKQVLKEEKIIKRNWFANGEQYGEYFNEL